MIWKKPVVEMLRDVLRFALSAALILTGVLMSYFILWFSARFLWQLKGWCERVLFGHPW